MALNDFVDGPLIKLLTNKQFIVIITKRALKRKLVSPIFNIQEKLGESLNSGEIQTRILQMTVFHRKELSILSFFIHLLCCNNLTIIKQSVADTSCFINSIY